MKRRSILTDNPPEALAQAAASAPSLGYSADREAGEALALAILDRCPPMRWVARRSGSGADLLDGLARGPVAQGAHPGAC